jgi:hypothetical protein
LSPEPSFDAAGAPWLRASSPLTFRFLFPNRPCERSEENAESETRSRHCLAERAKQPLEPGTATRLLQLPFITTHGHARERRILALVKGCLLRVPFAPQSCPCCAKDASRLPPTRFRRPDPPSWGGVVTCGSKSRAKVARDVPSLRFHALFSASGWRLARVTRRKDVLQSPPLSLFEHPLSSPRDPRRGWSARSAVG